jgi:hypothetical protein
MKYDKRVIEYIKKNIPVFPVDIANNVLFTRKKPLFKSFVHAMKRVDSNIEALQQEQILDINDDGWISKGADFWKIDYLVK